MELRTLLLPFTDDGPAVHVRARLLIGMSQPPSAFWQERALKPSMRSQE